MRVAVAVAVLVTAITVTVATAAGPVGMTVSPVCDVVLRLNGKPVATGTWRMRPNSFLPSHAATACDAGPTVSASAMQATATRAVVHESHAAVEVDYTYDLAGEDLTIVAHVVNRDPVRTLDPFVFDGLTFHFSADRPITGQLPAWHWTYLLASGRSLYHPSTTNPVGCWWARDDAFAFAAFSDSEFDRSAMMTADWGGRDLVIPSECRPQFYTDRSVPPGGSTDVTVTFRVSADRSLPHLLGGYKAAYDRHFPVPLMTVDDRIVCQWARADDGHITRGNPFGYHADWYRFDTARGTDAFVRRLAPAAQRNGFLGVIFWSLGGYDPPMYPPDFDVLPEPVAANVPALVRGFHDRGLRVGLAARPGDGVRRPPGQQPTLYRLSADDPEQMREDIARFHHAIGMGFDMFYLDSFGGTDLNDVRILHKIRAAVGPDVPLYCEYCTDVTLPFAGRYCEWTRDGFIRWNTPETYQALRLLCPRSPWICTSETGTPIPPEFARLGLTPVVNDDDARRIPPWSPAPPALAR